jgi:hypothetical protein
MSVSLLRPLSLGEALDTSLTLYRRLFPQLLGVSFVTQGVPLALGVYVEAAGGMFLHPGLGLLQILLAVLLGAIGTAASTFVVSEHYLGRTIDSGAALRHAVAFLGRLILLTLATSLVVGVGTILFVVPGLILLSGLIVATPALVIENLPDASTAMRRSWSLTRGSRGKLLSAYVLAILLLLIPAIAVGALAGMIGLSQESGTGMLLVQIIVSLFQILIFPFIYVVTTILYYDLRVRKEGFDLEMLASTLQPA